MLELNKIYNMDCIEGMKLIPDNSIDSIVTDPPYEIGFMGKGWDSTGIANNVDMRKECLRVLKPGGHLLSFAATRTYHRMACAIEDAGFEVRDMIEWVYGSGFPKSLNIGKAVDKLQGNEREVERNHIQSKTNPDIHAGGQVHITMPNSWEVTKGTSQYEGWGTALKPAHEPICMARKPLAEKTVAENCLKYGTGGINIDESRVETSENITIHKGNKFGGIAGTTPETFKTGGQSIGRFPANLIHDNSEEVRECFPDSGGGKFTKSGNRIGGDCEYSVGISGRKDAPDNYGDSGNASRFFKSIIYQAKASKSDRGEGNTHSTVKPIALMEYLIKMVTREGGTVLDPFTGSGTTLVAAKRNLYNYIGFELSKEYCDIIEARLKSVQVGLF